MGVLHAARGERAGGGSSNRVESMSSRGDYASMLNILELKKS